MSLILMYCNYLEFMKQHCENIVKDLKIMVAIVLLCTTALEFVNSDLLLWT